MLSRDRREAARSMPMRLRPTGRTAPYSVVPGTRSVVLPCLAAPTRGPASFPAASERRDACLPPSVSAPSVGESRKARRARALRVPETSSADRESRRRPCPGGPSRQVAHEWRFVFRSASIFSGCHTGTGPRVRGPTTWLPETWETLPWKGMTSGPSSAVRRAGRTSGNQFPTPRNAPHLAGQWVAKIGPSDQPARIRPPRPQSSGSPNCDELTKPCCWPDPPRFASASFRTPPPPAMQRQTVRPPCVEWWKPSPLRPPRRGSGSVPADRFTNKKSSLHKSRVVVRPSK